MGGGGGGGSEVIYFSWCWDGGQVFWVDRIAPSNKNFKPPRSGKIINICDNKRLPQKLLWEASPICPPSPCRKRDPLTHTEKMAPKWRKKTACPHRKNTPIGETPPPTWNFFILATPPGKRLYPPLRVPIMISTHFIPFV